jgi:hypothetical protein
MRSNRTWLNGAPPHVGWWNASVNAVESAWRWWDGHSWSFPCNPSDNIEAVLRKSAKYVSYKNGGVDSIQWTYYWPANARVARVAP